MVSLVALLTLCVGVGFLAKSQHSRRSPLQSAISATVVGLVFLVTGILGLQVDKHNYTFVTGTWTGTVLWWKVFAGLCLLLGSVHFWRRGLRRVAY